MRSLKTEGLISGSKPAALVGAEERSPSTLRSSAARSTAVAGSPSSPTAWAAGQARLVDDLPGVGRGEVLALPLQGRGRRRRCGTPTPRHRARRPGRPTQRRTGDGVRIEDVGHVHRQVLGVVAEEAMSRPAARTEPSESSTATSTRIMRRVFHVAPCPARPRAGDERTRSGVSAGGWCGGPRWGARPRLRRHGEIMVAADLLGGPATPSRSTSSGSVGASTTTWPWSFGGPSTTSRMAIMAPARAAPAAPPRWRPRARMRVVARQLVGVGQQLAFGHRHGRPRSRSCSARAPATPPDYGPAVRCRVVAPHAGP